MRAFSGFARLPQEALWLRPFLRPVALGRVCRCPVPPAWSQEVSLRRSSARSPSPSSCGFSQGNAAFWCQRTCAGSPGCPGEGGWDPGCPPEVTWFQEIRSAQVAFLTTVKASTCPSCLSLSVSLTLSLSASLPLSLSLSPCSLSVSVSPFISVPVCPGGRYWELCSRAI